MTNTQLFPYWIFINNRHLITIEVFKDIINLIAEDEYDLIRNMSKKELIGRIKGVGFEYFPKQLLDMDYYELSRELLDRNLDQEFTKCLNTSSIEIAKLLFTFKQWLEGKHYTLNCYEKEHTEIELILPNNLKFMCNKVSEFSDYKFSFDSISTLANVPKSHYSEYNIDPTILIKYEEIELLYNYCYFRNFGIDRTDLIPSCMGVSTQHL